MGKFVQIQDSQHILTSKERKKKKRRERRRERGKGVRFRVFSIIQRGKKKRKQKENKSEKGKVVKMHGRQENVARQRKEKRKRIRARMVRYRVDKKMLGGKQKKRTK